MKLLKLQFSSLLLVMPNIISAELLDLTTLKEELNDTTGAGGGLFNTGLIFRLEGFLVSAGGVALLALTVIVFLWVTYAAIAKFRECQAGRADWAELLLLGVVGAALLVFITILLSIAGGFLDEADPLKS